MQIFGGKDYSEKKSELDALNESIEYLKGLTLPDFSTKKSSKKETEIYIAKINQFQKLEDALALVNYQLEYNNILTDMAEDPDKINLLSERVKLLKDEQVALHNLAEERRKAISQNVSKLTFAGFEVSYDAASNQLAIKNMDRLNQLKGKNTEETNKLRKEYEELIKDTLSLNEANQDASQEWWELKNSIADTKESISDIIKSQVASQETGLKKIMNAEEKIHQDRLDDIDEEKKKYDDYIDDKIKQLDREKAAEDYNKDISKATKDISDLQKERNSYYVAAVSGDLEAKNKIAEIDKEITEKQEDLLDKQNDHAYDARKQNLQDSKETYDRDLDNQKDIENEKYELIKDAYDKLSNDISTFTDSSTTLNASMVDSMIADFNNLAAQFTGTTQQMANALSTNFISKLIEAKSNINALNGTITGTASSDVTSPSISESDVVDKMKARSIIWEKADTATRKLLEDKNLEEGTKLGWIRKDDGHWYKADGTRAYASGTLSAKAGLAKVNELGTELRVLNSGDGVVNAKLTKNLIDFAKIAPELIKIPQFNMPDFSNSINANSGSDIVNHFIFNVTGNLDKDVAKDIVEEVSAKFKTIITKNGQYRSI
jgi:hypothetical protein